MVVPTRNLTIINKQHIERIVILLIFFRLHLVVVIII
jgi:hypothetical protein